MPIKTLKNSYQLFRLIFVSGVLLISIGGCESNNPESFNLQGEALDFCVFDEGSEWIYQLEDSSEFDTVRLIKKIQSFVKGPDDNDNRYEQIEMDFSHSNYRYISYDFVKTYVQAGLNGSSAKVMQEFFPLNNSSGVDIIFVDKDIAMVVSHIDLISSDSVHFIGKKFESREYLNNTPWNHLTKTRITWSKGIGPTSFQLLDSSKWNLIKTNVIE